MTWLLGFTLAAGGVAVGFFFGWFARDTYSID